MWHPTTSVTVSAVRFWSTSRVRPRGACSWAPGPPPAGRPASIAVTASSWSHPSGRLNCSRPTGRSRTARSRRRWCLPSRGFRPGQLYRPPGSDEGWLNSLWHVRRELDVARARDGLPGGAGAVQGGDDRLDYYQVHELAIDDLLQGQGPERTQRLAVEPEGDDGDHELQEVEAQPEGNDRYGVGEDQAVEREQVDQRRHEGQQDLEEDHVGQCAESDAAVVGIAAEHRALVLPDGLHRPERPPVALAPQPAQRRGCFGPSAGVLRVEHVVSATADGERQVGVLSQGVA